MAEVRPADEWDFVRFYGPVQITSRWVGRAMWRGMAVVGFGGLIETAEGEWLAFLEVPEDERRPHIFRHVLGAFAEAKAQGATVIRAHCDTRIPRADTLLARLGLKPTEEVIDERVVWVWQN
ncbi:MAG: hypothetical protein ACK4P4_05480 [Allorhizobium sp.]